MRNKGWLVLLWDLYRNRCVSGLTIACRSAPAICSKLSAWLGDVGRFLVALTGGMVTSCHARICPAQIELREGYGAKIWCAVTGV